MGSRNLKMNKGKQYLYYIISENGKKRANYCGLASKPESEKRALKLELEEINKHKRNLTQKSIEIESKIKEL